MRKLGLAALLAMATVLAGGCGASPAGSSHLSVGVGPFWYMRTIGTMRAPRCAKPLPGVMNPCGSTVWFDVVMSTETWVGIDGTMRERSAEVSQRFASPADRARWLASHRPVPIPISIAQGDALDVGSGHFPPPPFGSIVAEAPPAEGPPTGAGPTDVGDGLFTYGQLLALPSGGGAAALSRIDRAWTALRHRAGRMLERWHSPGAAVVARGDLGPLPRAARAIQELTSIAHLDAAPVPPRVRLALFHAAAALPGARVTRGTEGGVQVSASFPHWEPVSFTFARETGELLTGPPMDGGPPDVAGPSSIVAVQGPVASITALPEGVKPIRGVGKPPLWPSPAAPAAETISPAIGRPSTVFAVVLAATAGERAHPAPTAWLSVTGSAGYGIYPGARGGSDPCLPRTSVRIWPATSSRRAGRLVYVYRVGPGRFHLRTWCAGRYELGLQTFPNPLPPRYTTPPYTGPSGTSIYFEVR
jgi:hypothetical protein